MHISAVIQEQWRNLSTTYLLSLMVRICWTYSTKQYFDWQCSYVQCRVTTHVTVLIGVTDLKFTKIWIQLQETSNEFHLRSLRDLHASVPSKNYHKWIELHSLFPMMLFKWPSQRLGEKRQKLWGNWYHWKKYSLLLYSLRSSQDLISNSPYCLPYNFYNVSLDHLILDQLIIP